MISCSTAGHREHSARYGFVCCECATERPLVFVCTGARTQWAESHERLTGHCRWLCQDLPLIDDPWPVKTYTAWPGGSGCFEVPERHVLALTGGDLFDCSCGVHICIRPTRDYLGTVRGALAKAHPVTR